MMKSAIFIDGVHIELFQLHDGRQISYQKLGDELTKGDFRVRTYFYTSMPFLSDKPTREELELYKKIERFHEALQKLPRFEIKLGRMQKINNKYSQKGVDMQLGVDMVQMSANKLIDKAILLATDSDFVYAITKAKDAGVVTTLVHFPNDKINPVLEKVVDETIELDDAFISKCLFTYN